MTKGPSPGVAHSHMTKALNLSPSPPLPNVFFSYEDGAHPCLLCSMRNTTLTHCTGIIWACLNNLVLNGAEGEAEERSIPRHTFSSWKVRGDDSSRSLPAWAGRWFWSHLGFDHRQQRNSHLTRWEHFLYLPTTSTWGRTAGTKVPKIIPILLFRVQAPKLTYLSLLFICQDRSEVVHVMVRKSQTKDVCHLAWLYAHILSRMEFSQRIWRLHRGGLSLLQGTCSTAQPTATSQCRVESCPTSVPC